ncbi:cytochrome P450 4V2 [Caerostris darwini]|uniref:Cytochrome P450 4V2 n=1 Tax=Caerostris darwini TaxID=1538125 RepID=A0AAV4QT30_9ARAC|nr:cytochrome P450 4V2 [Caerostris darwini]
MQGIYGGSIVEAKQRVGVITLGIKPAVIFGKAETVEVILSNSTLIEKGTEYKFLHPWLGTGLLTRQLKHFSPAAKWRHRRKLLTPTFHFTILEDFIPVFQEQSSVLVSKLQDITREPWVDIVPLVTSCTLDILCQTAMGVSINAQKGENNEYVKAVHKIAYAAMYRTFRPWLYFDFLFYLTKAGKHFKTNIRRVHGFTQKVITERKMDTRRSNQSDQQQQNSNSEAPKRRRKAFLELLLEQHLVDPSFTEEDVKYEVETFMFAGHDTTAMTLSWTLYCLGVHPEVQKIAFEEINDIFSDDPNRNVTREDLTRMKYMECVIKESLRLYPVVPFFTRECTEQFEVLGHKVYPGSICFIFPLMVHRDPEVFPEPEKFKPERFFLENSKGRHPYAYIPFSAGPRNCIGQKFAMMEVKLVIANILRRFRMTSLDPRDKVNVYPNLVLRNVSPLRLRFENRGQ